MSVCGRRGAAASEAKQARSLWATLLPPPVCEEFGFLFKPYSYARGGNTPKLNSSTLHLLHCGLFLDRGPFSTEALFSAELLSGCFCSLNVVFYKDTLCVSEKEENMNLTVFKESCLFKLVSQNIQIKNVFKKCGR